MALRDYFRSVEGGCGCYVEERIAERGKSRDPFYSLERMCFRSYHQLRDVNRPSRPDEGTCQRHCRQGNPFPMIRDSEASWVVLKSQLLLVSSSLLAKDFLPPTTLRITPQVGM